MKFLPILLCLFLGGDMVVDIAYNQTVQDLRSTEITISGNNFKSNKAKVFINGSLHVIDVQDGSFKITQTVLLNNGENKFQIDITCKGEYYQSKITINKQDIVEVKINLSDCVTENELMIPVESLKKLSYQVEYMPSLSARIWDDDSIIIKEGVREININGKTFKTDNPPIMFNNQLYLPISMLLKVDSITAKITNEVLLRRIK